MPVSGVESEDAEAGRLAWGNYLLIPPGTAWLADEWTTPSVVLTEGVDRVYRLTIQKQPGQGPEPSNVDIQVPAGSRIISTSPGHAGDGERGDVERHAGGRPGARSPISAMTNGASMAAVVVNHRRYDLVERCLESLQASSRPPDRMVVVDNDSEPGELAKAVRAAPHTILVENADNRGYAAACNQGWRAASADLTLFLNADVTVERDCLERCIAGHPGRSGCRHRDRPVGATRRKPRPCLSSREPDRSDGTLVRPPAPSADAPVAAICPLHDVVARPGERPRHRGLHWGVPAHPLRDARPRRWLGRGLLVLRRGPGPVPAGSPSGHAGAIPGGGGRGASEGRLEPPARCGCGPRARAAVHPAACAPVRSSTRTSGTSRSTWPPVRLRPFAGWSA